jgi:hypothetical protein
VGPESANNVKIFCDDGESLAGDAGWLTGDTWGCVGDTWKLFNDGERESIRQRWTISFVFWSIFDDTAEKSNEWSLIESLDDLESGALKIN